MKDHGLTLGLEQKQRVAAVHKKPTAHQKVQTGSPRPVTFWLYGIDTPRVEHELGSFYLYGLKLGQATAFELNGIGQYEHQSSHFDLYGVGRG